MSLPTRSRGAAGGLTPSPSSPVAAAGQIPRGGGAIFYLSEAWEALAVFEEWSALECSGEHRGVGKGEKTGKLQRIIITCCSEIDSCTYQLSSLFELNARVYKRIHSCLFMVCFIVHTFLLLVL
jgi:hypothetical protein